MQVDGTLGATAAITEMLMQSHDGHIKLLPALPEGWKDGEFNGVCARGAFELDFQWADGKVTKAKVLSKAGEVCRISLGQPIKISSQGKEVMPTKLTNGVIEFSTTKGKTYDLQPI